MSQRIFASLHPFFEGGAINGRKQANAGFMAELLRQDPFEQYHFFVGNPVDLEDNWAQWGHLSAVQRGAVRALHRTALPEALTSTPFHVCHFSDPVTGFVELTAARNRWAPELFPITAVNHTISYAEYAAHFAAHCWPGCTPREAIGCNSSAAQEVLRQSFAHLGAGPQKPAPRLTVIPMGAPPRTGTHHAAARAHMRARLKLAEESVLLLLFGRIALDDKLDPHPLCMALRRVKAQHPQLDVQLVISGFLLEGDNAPAYLEALGRLLGITLHVLPNPTLEEKESLYAAADIFLSPSDNIQETFGLTLVEAGMAGLPVIASDWDGYRDIIEDGVTGLRIPTLTDADTEELDALSQILFENQHHFLRAQRTGVCVPSLAEAIARLALNSQERCRMGEAARERAVRLFSWQSVVTRWLDFWEELRATPISPAQEKKARAARHPLHWPVGRMYAHYASALLEQNTHFRCTEAGQLWLRGQLPWAALGKAPHNVTQDLVRPLLVLARKPVNLTHMAERLPIHGETLRALILWALKHDLLESVANS